MSEPTSFINYVPILSTLVAAAFAVVLWRHWRSTPRARYMLWWAIGVAVYGVGTLTEAITTVFGWSEPVFRAWYIAGALLGGAPLAQGTVYLLLPKRRADQLSIGLAVYVAIAAAFVVSTPIVHDAVEANRLTGRVMEWQFVRAFSPLVNLYALAFLVGGAAWSAWRYWRRSDRPRARVVGNALIAVGALLPGIGGAFTRFGHTEVLYATELTGLLLIWAGYRAITTERVPSIHKTQQLVAAPGKADI